MIINTTHLEQCCHFLEEFISNITNVPPDTANATKLYGTSTFKVNTLWFSSISIMKLSFPKQRFLFLLYFMKCQNIRPFSHLLQGCPSCSRGGDLHQPERQNRPVPAAGRLRLDVSGTGQQEPDDQRLPAGPDRLSEEHLQRLHQPAC